MNPRLLIIACLFVALAVQPAIAHDEDHGPYFNADIGVALVDDVKLKEFPGAGPGTKLEFDPGLRLSYGGGYRLKEWLSLGLETGLIASSIKDADAALVQVPLMGNIELRLPNKSPLVPFIGGGPGASISVIGLDKESPGGGATVDGAAADARAEQGGGRSVAGHPLRPDAHAFHQRQLQDGFLRFDPTGCNGPDAHSPSPPPLSDLRSQTRF